MQRTKPSAILYARVSSKEQEKEGFSIPSQLKLLNGYAATYGIVIAEEFIDIETAKKSGRTGFGQMLAYLKQHPTCRTILVEKTDRLYRNLKDWVTLDELDLEIHFVKENVILSPDSRSSEKFMHGIKVLMAKNYIDNLSEETRKGMLEKADEGIYPSRAPLGYRNIIGPNGKKTIEPDPEYAPQIIKLFEWYATGNYSLRDVTKMAKAAGMVFRKSQNPVPLASVQKILRNRIYTGRFDWKGRLYQGNYEPLVSHELWERVQDVLDGRNQTKHHKIKHDFAFSRLVFCGHCGCSMVGEIKKQRYVYYHCTGYKGKCPEPYTREEVLEEAFGKLLRRLSFDNEVLAWVTEALKQSHEDERAHHAEAIDRLQSTYEKLQQRIDAMYVDKLDGRIDGAFFDRKAAEWRAEQDRLLRDIERHQGANQSYMNEGIRLLELAQKAHLLFQRQPAEEKRRLLNFVVSNCSWKGGELTANFRQPFDLLAVAATDSRKVKASGGSPEAQKEKWLRQLDSNQRHAD